MLCAFCALAPVPSAKSEMIQHSGLDVPDGKCESHPSTDRCLPGPDLSKATQLLPKDEFATAFKHMMQALCCEKSRFTI